jgi:hypothetical protein
MKTELIIAAKHRHLSVIELEIQFEHMFLINNGILLRGVRRDHWNRLKKEYCLDEKALGLSGSGRCANSLYVSEPCYRLSDLMEIYIAVRKEEQIEELFLQQETLKRHHEEELKELEKSAHIGQLALAIPT